MIHIIGTPIDTDRPFVMFDNILARATTVTATAGDGLSAIGEDTFDFWQPATDPGSLTATFAVATSAEALAVTGHNLGTALGTLTLRLWDGAEYITVAAVTPTTNAPFVILFPAVATTQWHVVLSGSTTAYVSSLVLGTRLVIPGYVAAPYVPSWAARKVEILGGVSRGGQFLGQRVQRLGAEFEVGFTPFEREWVSDTARAFMAHYNDGRPFVFASGPDEFPEDVAYCWRNGEELRPAYRDDSDLMDLGLSVSAYVEP